MTENRNPTKSVLSELSCILVRFIQLGTFLGDRYQNVLILQNVPWICISTFWEIGTFCKIRPKKYRSYKMYRFHFSCRNHINSYRRTNQSFILYFCCVKVHFQRSVHFQRLVLKCTSLAKSTFGNGRYWIEYLTWKFYIDIIMFFLCEYYSLEMPEHGHYRVRYKIYASLNKHKPLLLQYFDY